MLESDSSFNGKRVESIYKDSHISISHATDCAVPGLYKIKSLQHKESVLELTDIEFTLFTYMQRQLRIGLRTLFNVELCGLYFEEQFGQQITSYTIPFHIDRLKEHFSVEEYQPYIADYLNSYKSLSSYQQINNFNTGMGNMLKSASVRQDIENIKGGTVRTAKPNVPLVERLNPPSVIDEILEVSDQDELPDPPSGKSYFVCIGGSKNFQCFLSDNNMSKGEFILSHEDNIDKCLEPIYSDDQIIVRQDAKYAIPGFYIVSSKTHYRSIDEMPQDTYERCMLKARDIKHGLLTLGLERTHVYNSEKYIGRATAHLWVLPLHQHQINEYHLNPTVYSKDIWTYLDTFPRYSTTKPQILEFNEKMKRFLNLKHTS